MRNMRSARTAGALFEAQTAKYLSDETGLKIERRVRNGVKDRGDIAGLVTCDGRDVVVECKDYAGKYAGMLPGWLDEAERERENAGADLGVVVFKRRGYGEKSMGRQFVLMDLDTLLRLIKG